VANEEVNIVVKVKDQASAGIDKVKNGFQNLKSSGLIAVAAIAGITAAVSSFIKAARESEVATAKLNAALKNQGIYSAKTSEEMREYSAALQKITTFDDDAITSAQALLVSTGLQGDQLKEVTKLTLDFATAKGIDLTTASMIMSKASDGNVQALGRYGIETKNADGTTKSFAEVMEQMQGKFNGFSEAVANTPTGKLQQLGNAWGDLKEVLGTMIATILVPIINVLLKMKDYFDIALKAVTGFFSGIKSNIKDAGGLFGFFQNIAISAVQGILSGIRSLVSGFDALIDKFNAVAAKVPGIPTIDLGTDTAMAKLDALNARLEGMKSTGMAPPGTEETVDPLSDPAVMNEQMKQDAITQSEDQSSAARLENQKKIDAQRLQNQQATMQSIASLSQSGNKTLAGIGKAAALTQIAIDTPVAIGKALGSAPPPINFGLAALVGAAMAAQAAQVAGVSFATGGIVTGPTAAMVGDNPSGVEAIVPLEKAGQMGFGGGSTTLNVYIQGPIMGDSTQAREFAEKIDSELFKLKQQGQSAAFA